MKKSKANPDAHENRKNLVCSSNKLQRIKPPLVPYDSFPSRVSFFEKKQPNVTKKEKLVTHSVGSLKPDIGRPPITYWRRAEFTDREEIFKLVENSNFLMDDLFGEADVPNLIEKSSFAIVQFNSEKELVTFTSLFSYPDIPAVPAFDWYLWLESTYRLKNAHPRNTFFIHYMVWDKKYYNDFLRLTLETVFLENPFLTHIIITKPPKVKLPSIFMENFIQVLPADAEYYRCSSDSLQTVLLCLKHTLRERLKIRLAIVEDHDDLMPIAEQHTERLRELYGNFCIAEIIEFPGTPDRKTLVCESKGYAVGFMNINKAVDFDLLNSQFDLAVFNGLKKPGENDVIVQQHNFEEEEEPIYLPETIDPFLEIIDSNTMLKFLNWKPSLCVNEEELSDVELISLKDPPKGYNELSVSMTDLIKETLNVTLVPKFSGHALSVSSTDLSKSNKSYAVISSGSSSRSSELTRSEEAEVQSEQSLISLQHYNLPTYTGAPNAFCIEFYAMHKDFDDRLCHDFLEAAFEVFPDLEYCLLTIPSLAPTFPLLDFFTRVTPRPLKRFRQELYVCHKSCAMITFMRVRRITKSDLMEIRILLKGIKNNEHIYADVASSCYFDQSAYQGFVLICSKAIVGVAVLCNEHGMEYLAHHYHVAELIDFDLHKMDYHAILKHLVLSPVFQPHARFFLRDIMRMADVTSLYRTRYEEVESYWTNSSLITTHGLLVPVRPKRWIKYHQPSLGPNMPPYYFINPELPFSLYHINSRICGLKKFSSNMNIVVVGASGTAYAFLEALLFASSSAYVTYNNITWVSPHGMGTELPFHKVRDLMFPFKGKYSRFYKIQLCLKTYVNFVYGVMTNINRVEKYITINNKAILPYDYLVLLCGRQFSMPVPLSERQDMNACRRSIRPRCSLFKYLVAQQNSQYLSHKDYPANVFLINTDVDATNALISLQYLLQIRKNTIKKNEKIIIYGHHISAFLCIHALLKFGIKPGLIILVEPFPSGTDSISCFGDENIDNAVIKCLSELGVERYEGFILYSWNFCDKKQVHEVNFHSFNRKITIQCLAMFPFENKTVSEVTFKAVNEASLVYDGKLVINNSFQTNDPYIYAAGGLTKYQRKYYARDKSHKHFNATEVGTHLANILRKKIDPTEEITPDERSELVPNMTKPLILFGVLPGDWNYYSIRKPGKFEDPETKAGNKEFGDVLTTGDCEMSNGHGYFKLMLDDYGYVSGITCYTKEEIDCENLEMLYGKHEKLLNNLLYRFDLGLIDNFYSYFREPWIYALFHDRFGYVQTKNLEFFYQEVPKFKSTEKIIDLIIRTLKESNWKRPSNEKLKEIQEKFDESDIKGKIVENILNFLYYFDEPFPMYSTHRILRVLLYDANKSLLHKAVGDNPKSALRIYGPGAANR